ncbi:hypothetical protein C5167_029610, partial [Papaver somniferum]
MCDQLEGFRENDDGIENEAAMLAFNFTWTLFWNTVFLWDGVLVNKYTTLVCRLAVDYESAKIKRKLDFMPICNWDSKSYFCDGYADEDNDGVYVKMLVPGLRKENIKKVRVDRKIAYGNYSNLCASTL